MCIKIKLFANESLWNISLIHNLQFLTFFSSSEPSVSLLDFVDVAAFLLLSTTVCDFVTSSPFLLHCKYLSIFCFRPFANKNIFRKGTHTRLNNNMQMISLQFYTTYSFVQ